uniref:X-ray repair cross complementing 4 isoform x1 n=1 Tax=Brachionus koreanus TaxID=1199090 RepID=A0A7G7WNJ2_9BILA|nr:X-ray repair cross complementing 4 isoform x1 [Brachionus koreanus]
MVQSELLSSFKHEKNKRFSLLQIWNDDDQDEFLKLILTDYLNYWTGKYSLEEIKKFSNLNDFDINGIKQQFIDAFATDFQNFSLKVEGLETKKLEIKKVLDSEIKVKVISIELKIASDSSLLAEEIFNFSIKKIKNLQKRNELLENEIQELREQKNEAVESLRECVNEKEAMEFDLYSKFVQILNEKKSKIRELAKSDE